MGKDCTVTRPVCLYCHLSHCSWQQLSQCQPTTTMFTAFSCTCWQTPSATLDSYWRRGSYNGGHTLVFLSESHGCIQAAHGCPRCCFAACVHFDNLVTLMILFVQRLKLCQVCCSFVSTDRADSIADNFTFHQEWYRQGHA